jgi:Flp pilus assembly protein CpaB
VATTNTPTAATTSTSRSRLGLWLAIGFGLLAAGANMRYVGLQSGSSLTVGKAKQRLLMGRTVSASDFDWVPIYGPDLRQMKALFVERDRLDSFSNLALGESLLPGQPLMQTSFGYGGTRDLRDAVAANERAITLRVETETAAAGYHPVPGSIVNVWVQDPGGTTGAEPKLDRILESVTIRAVDRLTQVPGPGDGTFRYRTVTVVVPQQMEQTVLGKIAPTKGAVTLTLLGRCGLQPCS